MLVEMLVTWYQRQPCFDDRQVGALPGEGAWPAMLAKGNKKTLVGKHVISFASVKTMEPQQAKVIQAAPENIGQVRLFA